MPCSGVTSIVLRPDSNWSVCAQAFALKSQNLMVPSLEQLTTTYFAYWMSLVICDVCSVGKFLMRLPTVISHIFIVLSRPALRRVILSWSSTMVQMKSRWPVIVFRQAELYFLVRLQTFIVLSALPETSVFPVLVQSRHNISLICPVKFFVFYPFS